MSGFFEEAFLLLHVAEKSLQWPKLQPLHDAAMNKLTEMQAHPPAPPPQSKPPVVEPLSTSAQFPNLDRREPAETFQQEIEDHNE